MEVGGACFKIARHIVKHGRVSRDDFFKLAGSYQKKKMLLGLKIFAPVPNSDWITFESKPTELVAREVVAKMEAAGGAGRWAVRQP